MFCAYNPSPTCISIYMRTIDLKLSKSYSIRLSDAVRPYTQPFILCASPLTSTPHPLANSLRPAKPSGTDKTEHQIHS